VRNYLFRVDDTLHLNTEFFKNDSKARGIIGLAISADIQPVIENCPSAYEAWWALADHFALVAKSNKMYYQVLLFKTEMKSNETLLGYLNSIIRSTIISVD